MVVIVSLYICVGQPQKWVYDLLVCRDVFPLIIHLFWERCLFQASFFPQLHPYNPTAVGVVRTWACSSAICATYLYLMHEMSYSKQIISVLVIEDKCKCAYSSFSLNEDMTHCQSPCLVKLLFCRVQTECKAVPVWCFRHSRIQLICRC